MSADALDASSAAPDAGEVLRERLRAASRRIRFIWLVRAMAVALLAAACADLLCLLLGRLAIVPAAPVWLLALPYLLAAPAAAAYAGLRPLSELTVARVTESRADLNERLSSVLELSGLDVPFVQALRRETAGRISTLDLRALYPARLPRTLAIALLVTALWLGATLLPVIRHGRSATERRDAEEVIKRGAAIEKLARDTLKTAEQHKLEESRKASEEARKLGEAMRRGRLSKKEALVALNKLTRKMEETEKRMAAPAAAKSMQQAQSEFKRALDRMERESEARPHTQTTPGKVAANKPKPANAPDKTAQKPESAAMKQAKSALAKMQDAMRQMNTAQMQEAMKALGDAMRSGMSPGEMQQMGAALQALANSLKGTSQNSTADALQQLAAQMATGNATDADSQRLAEMMNRLAKQMGKGAGTAGELDAKTLEGLCRALKEGRMAMCMGKDGMPGSMRRKGPGRGWNGYGDPHKAMKDPGETKARLLAASMGLDKPSKGRQGSAQQMAKLMTVHSSAPGHLPNGKIAGTRNLNGQELQQNSTGDPDPMHGGASYYQVFQTSRRAAEDTVSKESIPATYKKQVHDYFDTIRP
jgi:hypothetical protein